MSSCIIGTPFCELKIVSDAGYIVAIDFMPCEPLEPPVNDALLKKTAQQIQAYCSNPARLFDLPLAPQGTDFQQRVWAEILKIPCGQVNTYSDIAFRLRSSPRAVGNACRKNPILLLIPCHRVVAKKGLGGFAGAVDGAYVAMKRHLLSHEGVEFD